MDAPETEQPRGRESERSLRLMLEGRRVTVCSVAADRYGRWVSTVTLEGVDAGLAMVARGEAWAYRAYLWALPDLSARSTSPPKQGQDARVSDSGPRDTPRRLAMAPGATARSCSAFWTLCGFSGGASSGASGGEERRPEVIEGCRL